MRDQVDAFPAPKPSTKVIPKFIRVTLISGEPIFINSNRIERIDRFLGGTVIAMVDGSEFATVHSRKEIRSCMSLIKCREILGDEE